MKHTKGVSLPSFRSIYVKQTTLTQRVVNQYEAREHGLYSKAREAESLRRKQVQVVDKLQEDLEQLKQRNAVKLKVSYIP